VNNINLLLMISSTALPMRSRPGKLPWQEEEAVLSRKTEELSLTLRISINLTQGSGLETALKCISPLPMRVTGTII
jgi:hypothetical protein